MLIVKYSKTGPAKYASHVDTLRAMGRILARADVSVGYSEGFNPHALLFFSPPNAVGVDSLCEYVAVAAGEERDFIGRFNAAAPCGFTALRVWTTQGNPNLAGVIDGARYEIKSPGIGTADYGKIKDGFVVEYDGKDGKKSKDYASYVISVTTENDDKITAVLKAGPLRLRAILMTTISTLIGSLPVALALSEGGETRQPMSVAVIGGLATSTMLTLLVIPVVYLIFDDITDRVKASIRRFNAYRRLKSHGRGA